MVGSEGEEEELPSSLAGQNFSPENKIYNETVENLQPYIQIKKMDTKICNIVLNNQKLSNDTGNAQTESDNLVDLAGVREVVNK